MHEVDLLFECILIRDCQAALPCWFPKSYVQTIVNYTCARDCECEMFLYVFCSFFSLFLCVFCCFFVLFFVYLGTIYIINKIKNNV